MNGISDEIGDTPLDNVNDVSLNTPVSIIDSNGVHIGSIMPFWQAVGSLLL